MAEHITPINILYITESNGSPANVWSVTLISNVVNLHSNATAEN